MATVTLQITERKETGWVVAYITSQDSEFPIAGVSASLRTQPGVHAAWNNLLQSIIDDFATFNGLTEVISDTTTEVKHRGDA